MSKREVIRLYRALIRESRKFPAYNFRQYALRRVRDKFRENKNLTSSEIITNKLEEASKSLDIIKRQVVIGQLYSTDKLVIENIQSE